VLSAKAELDNLDTANDRRAGCALSTSADPNPRVPADEAEAVVPHATQDLSYGSETVAVQAVATFGSGGGTAHADCSAEPVADMTTTGLKLTAIKVGALH
jgi:hypothetical protein